MQSSTRDYTLDALEFLGQATVREIFNYIVMIYPDQETTIGSVRTTLWVLKEAKLVKEVEELPSTNGGRNRKVWSIND